MIYQSGKKQTICQILSRYFDIYQYIEANTFLPIIIIATYFVNSLPIAAMCDVTNNTTQRPMEIFPSKPRTRCNVVPQMTHRVHRIYPCYRVCMHESSFVFFMKMKRTILEMSIKYSGIEELVSNEK